MELLKVDSLDSEGSSYTDPSSSASDSDAFNQSETTYKGNFFILCLLLLLELLSFLFFPKDQLLKARTSIVKRVRSVGKSSRNTPSKHHHPLPRSQSQSPHPPPLATLPPVSPSPSSALGSGSKFPNPVSPFDFSSPSSATTPRRNLHHPSSSASDSDAFNQSSEATYKGKIAFFTSFFFCISPF